MPASLSSSQIAAYSNDGFVFPVDVMSAGEAKDLRSDIETMEKTYPDGSLPQPISQYFRVGAHVVIPFMAECDYAMLVRGCDSECNWINVAALSEPFGDDAMALYPRIRSDQSVALAQGATRQVGLYADAATGGNLS